MKQTVVINWNTSLSSFPNLKFAELTSIVLQHQGEGATWMFEALYYELNNIKKFEYTDENLDEQIECGITWAEKYSKSFGNYQRQNLSWIRSK